MRGLALTFHPVRWITAICCAALIAAAVPVLAADDWHPRSEYKGEWDWVQMTSGEWLKGEILAMYDDDLEFDSDEFDDQVLGWGDIAQIHSSQVMNVGFVGQETATGILIVKGDQVLIVNGDEVQEFTKDQVLTITAGVPKEINFWDFKVFAGLIVRTGNSEVRELNLQADIKRRTVKNRILASFSANQNTTEGTEVSNKQRANISWDKYISDRFFVTPIFGEYFADEFQNIDARYTAGVGVGYQLMDSRKVDWKVSGGPAYQETEFVSVEAGQPTSESTGAAVLETIAEWDITPWLEFDGNYRIQFVNEESGGYNMHLLASFEADITSVIDFDVSWVWDRIDKPNPGADGIVPKEDDFRTTVGLTFEF